MYFWHIDCSYRKQTAINKEDHGASAETRSCPVINVNIPITVLVIALLLLISGARCCGNMSGRSSFAWGA